MALVLSFVAPVVLGVVVLVPWSDDLTYAFLDRRSDGSPLRWNPCVPIHYEVNLTFAPPGATDDVFEAVARASKATGIRFVFDGWTDRSPSEQRQSFFRVLNATGYHPVLISWLPAPTFDTYADPHRAIGVGWAVPGAGASREVYRSGLVVINADAPIPLGFDTGSSLGPVLMHELGHVLGLGHVRDSDEIMWSPQVAGADPFPISNTTDWGSGDLQGLERLGRSAGCVSDPA